VCLGMAPLARTKNPATIYKASGHVEIFSAFLEVPCKVSSSLSNLLSQ